MKTMKSPPGSIYMSHRSIAAIASQSAMESYGVVGLAPKNIAFGLANVIVKDPMLGVDVILVGPVVTINLYIIVEYGTRIKSVADNVSELVKYQIEKITGLSVNKVNIHVRGLRISNTD